MGELIYYLLKLIVPWIKYGIDAYEEEQTGIREYTGDDTSLSGGTLPEDAEALRVWVEYEKEKQAEEMRRIEERYENRNLDPDMLEITAKGVIEPKKDEENTEMEGVSADGGTLSPYVDENGDSFDKGFMENI
ncbi:MAG: hypothetical protein E7497_06530 [Ruminococcus sp.]|nr:hypothetical protein [Ruminococcus sp.]